MISKKFSVKSDLVAMIKKKKRIKIINLSHAIFLISNRGDDWHMKRIKASRDERGTNDPFIKHACY